MDSHKVYLEDFVQREDTPTKPPLKQQKKELDSLSRPVDIENIMPVITFKDSPRNLSKAL